MFKYLFLMDARKAQSLQGPTQPPIQCVLGAFCPGIK